MNLFSELDLFMFPRCDNNNERPLEAEVIPVLHSVAEANASDESDGVAKQEDEQIGIIDHRQIRRSSGCLAEHKFKPFTSTIGSKDQADQTPPLHPVFHVI